MRFCCGCCAAKTMLSCKRVQRVWSLHGARCTKEKYDIAVQNQIAQRAVAASRKKMKKKAAKNKQTSKKKHASKKWSAYDVKDLAEREFRAARRCHVVDWIHALFWKTKHIICSMPRLQIEFVSMQIWILVTMTCFDLIMFTNLYILKWAY